LIRSYISRTVRSASTAARGVAATRRGVAARESFIDDVDASAGERAREDASARRGATAIRARDAIIAHGFDRPRATTRSGAARACARLKDE
jgi:hypothetical protein